METVDTSLPRKLRDLFDKSVADAPEECVYADSVAAGIIAVILLEPELRYKLIQLARCVRKDKANDIRTF